jgi:ketosteroid isomerase-like protein
MNILRRLAILMCTAALMAGCSHTTPGTPQPSPSTSTAAAGKPSGTVTAPSAPPSDEAQIRETIKQFQDASNSQNWDAYLEVMCAPMRAQFTPGVMDYLKKDRARNGATTAVVTSVKIDGDNATANLTSTNEVMGTRDVQIPLKHEDDGWKICHVS